MHRNLYTLLVVVLSAFFAMPVSGGPVDWELEEYALYAGGNISFRERSNITGHIGVGGDVTFREDCKIDGGVYLGRNMSSRERVLFTGDLIAGNDVYFRHDCIIEGSISTGRRASVDSRTRVMGDLTAGDSIWVHNSAVVDGDQNSFTTPSDTWVQESVTFPTFSPGSTDLNLAASQTHTIEPGQYRNLVVGQYCTIKLRSGVYHFSTISMREHGKWEFDDSNGPVVVHVARTMSTREHTTFLTDSGDSDGLTLWVQQNLSFREYNKFIGQIRVNGNVSLREGFDMTGTIYALRTISVREDSKFKNATPPPVFYVRKRGSDSHDGRTPSTAFRTIQKGVNSCVVEGSVVYVGPGVYEESVDIGAGVGAAAVSGTSSKPIRIVGDAKGEYTNDDPGQVIIDGRSARDNGMTITNRVHWEISGLSFENQRRYNIRATNSGINVQRCEFDVPAGYSIYVTAIDDTTVEECVFNRDSNSLHVIWVQPMSSTIPMNIKVNRNDLALDGEKWNSSGLQAGWSSIHRGSWGSRYTYGIVVFAGWRNMAVESVEISNNVVSDCYLPIYWGGNYGSSTDSVIANNTVTGSFYSIYSYSYSSSAAVVANNIIDTCYFGGLVYTYRSDPAVVVGLLEHNIIYGMARYSRPFELDIITDAPVFNDPRAGDFSLAGGSPGVDAGSNQYAPGVDFLGESRPTDGDNDGIAIVDLGAFETINAPTKVRMVRWKEIGSEHNRD